VKYKFIQSQVKFHSIKLLCSILKVSRSGYYAWKKRPLSIRKQRDNELLSLIKRIHKNSRHNYGTIKTWEALKEQGVICCKHRVARLRRENKIEAKRITRFKQSYAARNSEPASDNTLNRCFTASQPNQKWVSDTTYIRTHQGWLFLAVVIDLFARKVVGWSMSSSNSSQLVCNAATMAINNGTLPEGLLHHSDQGIQYTSNQYKALLKSHSIEMSMSRKGECHDNAVAESFFSNLKNELIHHESFKTRAQARTAIFEYIEIFYNRKRLHQSLGYQSPEAYERMYMSRN